jgi:integrase
MAIVKFTEAGIARLPAPDGAQRSTGAPVAQLLFTDQDTPGLHLVVGKTRRTWVFKAPSGLRTKIGTWPAWSLAMARTRARELRVGAESGSPRVGMTLDDAFSIWKRRKAHATRTVETYEANLRLHLSAFRSRRLTDITRAEVLQRHASIAKKSGVGIADLSFRIFRAIWSAARKMDANLGECPTAILEWTPTKRGDAHALLSRLPAWNAALPRIVYDPLKVVAFRFALATGLRKASLLAMEWRHLDRDASTLLIPNPKGGSARAFRLPLLDVHWRMIDAAGERGHPRWVWGSEFNLSRRMADLTVSPIMKTKFGFDWSTHDLRRVFRTCAAEAEVPWHLANMLTNHAVPAGTLGSYVSLDTDLRPSMTRTIARIEERLGGSLLPA